MPIICGVDFSEMSGHALKVAGLLAHKTHAHVHLVHATPVGSSKGPELIESWHEHRLEGRARQLRELGLTVLVHVREGAPDEVLQDVARERGAELIVTAATSRHGRRALGDNADRIARGAQVPVLTVRDAAPFREWLEEERPLRITFGLDHSPSCESASELVRALRVYGPCEVTAIHLYVPPTEFERLGLGGLRSYVSTEPEVAKAFERQYERLLSHLGAGYVERRFEPSIGKVGERLSLLSAEMGADLIVVGSRASGPAFWDASVSRDVLHSATTAVICVPEASASKHVAVPKRFASIVAATDFSEAGNAALELAYSVGQAGSTVHLVHVVDGPYSLDEPTDVFVSHAQYAEEWQRLGELAPSARPHESPHTTLHVLRSNDPAKAICQAAERLNADLICLGTHGRSGLARALLGSVAESVLRRARPPVLLTRSSDQESR